MSPADWATTIAGFSAVSIAFFAGLRWLVKSYLIELKPNGGSSLKDAVNDIKEEIIEVRIAVAHLNGKYEEHISHCGHK